MLQHGLWVVGMDRIDIIDQRSAGCQSDGHTARLARNPARSRPGVYLPGLVHIAFARGSLHLVDAHTHPPEGNAVGNMPGIPEREELPVLEIVRPVEVADLRVEVDPLAVAVEPERTHDLRILEGSDAAVERIDRTRLGQLPAGIDRCGRLQMVGRRLLHGRELAGAVSHRTQGDHIADGV